MRASQVAIGIGCLVLGLFLGGIFVGRATAQGGPPVRRIEYTCHPQIERPWKPEGAMRMNTLGAQGWELVQQLPSNPDVYCFKRALFY